MRLEASPPVIKIVLPSEVGDRYSRILSRDDLDVVTPVQVIDISPSRVEVAFQPKLSRDLRINAPKVVGLSSDFRVAEIKLNPEVVNVVGAASEIRALSDIELEPVDLTGEVVPEDGKVVERPLIIRVPGRFVDILPGNETKISLTIVPITSERTLSKLPVEVRSQGDINFKIIPSSVDVVVSGLKSKIEALKDKDIIPYAKVYSDFSDNQKFPVLVDLPGSIKVIRTVPDFLTVRRDSRKRIDTSRSKGSK